MNFKIQAPSPINNLDFTLENNNLIPKYGLNPNVEFCSLCVISNQRPNSSIEFRNKSNTKKETIKFQNNICDACLLSESKEKTINWAHREKELIDLCNKYRKNNGSYDCIVPGSGGKDSFFASHILKNKYQMNPLTVTWAPHIYTDWGYKNFHSWINAGHDNYLLTPNGRVHRLLTRLAIENLFHPFQPFMIGQKNIAPKIAALHGIDLIFYGENEAEYGNPVDDNVKPTRSKNFFSNNYKDELYLGGMSIRELTEDFNLSLNDLNNYMPMQDSTQLDKLECHYLGYYLKWHPQSCYYYTIENSDFQPSPERTLGTYSKYSSIDDKMDDFHFYTTGIKFGIGRASHDASQEIRSGDITRQEGVSLVKKFDLEYPSRFEDEIFNYLTIDNKNFKNILNQFENPIFDQNHFKLLTDSFRSPHIWLFQNNNWTLRNTVY